ncbi:MAG: YggS family pyridoxal phosphate enzyme [Epulopiscium sp. Nuni2H_MBin003]|nr:MAG: YggS family pyridoxal phosphate enzyme [Epulopiscium sp. Nuni2H_MBin003]
MQEKIIELKKQLDGRTDILLVAVSKTYPISAIEEAYKYGLTDFGENKVQELLEKIESTSLPINWHLIGHLQTNKVKYIIDKVKLIHSVDSIKLLAELERQAIKKNITVDVLLQINVAREESKYGFYVEEIEDALEYVQQLQKVNVKGLMTVAPFVKNAEENKDIFTRLYEIFIDISKQKRDNVNMDILSMGMSGDFAVAIKCGSNCIRVGSFIFGNRQ